eukprot:GGOE01054876.1.p2 GENE.GGOE01054876.1~~GGOE01054876.1.p2  ORF type:complete len:114 (+),score=5.68 GGOE01054876.1:193-534(+)
MELFRRSAAAKSIKLRRGWSTGRMALVGRCKCGERQRKPPAVEGSLHAETAQRCLHIQVEPNPPSGQPQNPKHRKYTGELAGCVVLCVLCVRECVLCVVCCVWMCMGVRVHVL